MTPDEKRQQRFFKRLDRIEEQQVRLAETKARVLAEMHKPPPEELQKHTLNLWRGDYQRLRELFPDLGAGYVIRKVVRNYILRVEADRSHVMAEVTNKP